MLAPRAGTGPSPMDQCGPHNAGARFGCQVLVKPPDACWGLARPRSSSAHVGDSFQMLQERRQVFVPFMMSLGHFKCNLVFCITFLGRDQALSGHLQGPRTGSGVLT